MVVSSWTPLPAPQKEPVYPHRLCTIRANGHIEKALAFLFFWGGGVFLGAQVQHTEVPRLGVELELQLLVYVTATAQKIPAASSTYTTVHDNDGSLTHRARPGIEPTSSWMLVGLLPAEPQQELLPWFS